MEGNEVNQSPVCVARALVTAQDETVPLRVVNTSLAPTTLYKNSRIATAEQLNESSICQAVESEKLTPTEEIHSDYELVLEQPFPDDITEAEREQFMALLSYYSNVKAAVPNDLGRTSLLQHHINTNTSPPIRQSARRIPLPCTSTTTGNDCRRNHLTIQEPLGIPNHPSKEKGWHNSFLC